MKYSTSNTEAELDILQRQSFDYFLFETNPRNGLVVDKTASKHSPCSIAATVLALAAYPIAVERGYMSKALAIERTLITLRFFFTVDTSFLLAGMLAAALYFDGPSENEQEIRHLSNALYCRVDWQWAQNEGETVTMGWKPESGCLPYRWEGYDEAMLLYLLGLGSPTFSLPESSYLAWTKCYEWKQFYGYDYLYSGSLFTHQLLHLWIDFLPIKDAYGWISPSHIGINQGPIVIMTENYRNNFLWRLMRNCPYLIRGLKRAGFIGGYLNDDKDLVYYG